MKDERQQYQIETSSTTHTYVYCRMAAREALKSAQETQGGNLYWRMMAGVFAAFTIEAYLNHIGQRHVRTWDAFERKLGPREKLLLLQQIFHLSADHSRRPFQTFQAIIKLRNLLAHSRTTTEGGASLVHNPRDESAPYPEPEWMQLCALESVTRMVEDGEDMVRCLASQFDSQLDPFGILGYGSFGAPRAVEES